MAESSKTKDTPPEAPPVAAPATASNPGDELTPEPRMAVTPAEAADRDQEPTNVILGVKPVTIDPFEKDVDNPFDQQGYVGVDINRQFARPSVTEQPLDGGDEDVAGNGEHDANSYFGK